MDPAFFATLSKVMGLGISLWKAHEKHGLEDVAAMKSFLDAGESIARFHPDGAQIGVHHFMLVVSAFGEALKRYWCGDEHFAPGAGVWAWLKGDPASRARRRQIEERVQIAAPKLQEVGYQPAADEIALVSSMVGDPVGTPYYKQLWSAFAAELTPGEKPLVMPGDRLQFERHFRLAYAEGLASGRGEHVRQHLMTLKEGRGPLVRELLIRDMVGWGKRHAFWSAEGQDGLPDMPLKALYVEPGASDGDHPTEPVLGLLERAIEEHGVTVVRADFGHGKSLTARMLAWRRAERYLAEASASPELWCPLFVRCAEDFHSHRDDLHAVLRRAQWRQAQGLQLALPLHDDVFDPARIEGRTLVIIDGLDEVALSDREVADLFRQMREQASTTRRFLVFTRPAALGRGEGLEDVPVLDLLPFTTRNKDGEPGGQVDEWLARWRRCTNRQPAPTAVELEERNLLSVAKTPILLFMMADSWHTVTVAKPSLGGIYEGFFRDIARGKHESDKDSEQADRGGIPAAP